MNETLMHYGVKGQSWGKRNFQYEDGTLTAEGKERYSKGLTRSGASVFRSNKPKIGQQVWTAKRSMTKAGDLPEETKEKLLERVRQARQGGVDNMKSRTPEMTREAMKSELSPEEHEKLKETTPKTLGTPETTHEVKETKLSPEEREKLKETAPKSLGMAQEMAKTDLGKLSPEEQEKLRKKRAAAIKPVEPKKAVTMCDSSEDSLMHYGILGMKWGIRRYQNSDGSLTAAGRKRYGDDTPDGNSSSSGNPSDSTPRTPAKSASEMTDQELNQALNRLRMEQQYNELTGAKSSNQYQNQQNFSTPPSNTGNLSNAELQAYITRLDMEKRYKQLTTPPPKELNMGQKFVKEILPAVALEVGRELVKNTMRKALGLEKSNDGSDNDGSGKKNKNNNNNDGGKQKNYDKQFNETNSRIDKLASAINNLANNKQSSKSESKSSDSSGDEEKSSTSIVPYSEHRKSIIGGAKAAANAARENKKNRDALQDRLKGYRDRRETARNEEEERRKTAANNSSDYYRSMWTYGM